MEKGRVKGDPLLVFEKKRKEIPLKDVLFLS